MQVLEKIDTRDWIPGTTKTGREKRIYLSGTGEPHICDRCGEQHEVHYIVQTPEGEQAIVGHSCSASPSMERRAGRSDVEECRLTQILFELLTADLDPALVGPEQSTIRRAIRAAIRGGKGREPNPGGLAEALYDLIAADLPEDQRRELAEQRIPILQAIHGALGEQCATCEACPAYCGTERAYQDKRGALDGWWGQPCTVIYPLPGAGKGLGELSAVYALLDAALVITSHDPITFAESPTYPRDLQERAYDRDQLEQIKVMRQAEGMIPSLLINSNPDAVNGPPIVDPHGFVLGGNSRAMSIKRVLAEGPDNRYTLYLKRALNECGGVFGLAGAPVEGAIMVRVVLGAFDPVRISRDLNRSLTQVISSAAEAVSLGRMLPPELFGVIGDAMFAQGEAATLNAALADSSAKVVSLLQKAGVITAQNYGQYTATVKGKATSDLSSMGRQRIRDAIVGALVSDKESMSLLSPSQEKLYEAIAPALLILDHDDPKNSQGQGYNFTPSLRKAIGLLTNRPTTQMRVFQEQFEPELSFEAGGTIESRYPEVFADPLAAILARWLVEAQAKPMVALAAVREYVQQTPGRSQGMMFATEHPPETLRAMTLGKAFPSGRVTVGEVEQKGIRRFLEGR